MGVKVRERKDKPGWWAFVHHHGRRTKRCFGTDKQAALRFAEVLSARLKLADMNGEHVDVSSSHNEVPTVHDFITEWLKTYAEVHCKPNTAEGYRALLFKHVVPVLGDRRLNEVTRADVKRLIADLCTQGLKKQTVHNILTPLKEAYHHAMDDGIVASNPVARTGRLTRSREDRRMHVSPLTANEVRAMLEAAREKQPVLFPILLCAVRTGLRQGELIGLQWSDLDFRHGFIEVRRAVVRRRLTTPKSHKLRRVDMSPQLIEGLRHTKETRELETGMSGNAMSEWVFLTPSGTRWDDSNLRHAFDRLLQVAEIRHVRFHDLRHTYASLMAAQGTPPKYIQEQLGHSSIQVTMDIYAHLFPTGNREWSKRLDDVKGPAGHAPHTHPNEIVVAANEA